MRNLNQPRPPQLCFCAAAAALLFVCAAGAAAAQDQFSVPELTSPVVDKAALLTPASVARLDNLLRSVRSSTGTQLTVLTLPDLGGMPIEEVSIRVVDAWHLGSAKEDTGVLLLVAKAERKMRIEVGQGLEGVLPDAYAKRIIDEMRDYFRAGDFDGGIIYGVDRILSYTNPDYAARPPLPASASSEDGAFVVPLIIIILFLFLHFSFGSRRRRNGGMSTWGGAAFRGGSSGGGSFRSGGGWSGGGGSFSGGGASGDW